MKTMITRNNVLRHNGTMRCLWAETDRGNFGSLLRAMGYCSAARSGSVQELVEASGSRGSRREAVEDVRKQVGDKEGVGRGATLSTVRSRLMRTKPNPQVLGSVLCEGGPDPYLQVRGPSLSGLDLGVKPGSELVRTSRTGEVTLADVVTSATSLNDDHNTATTAAAAVANADNDHHHHHSCTCSCHHQQ